MKGHLTFIRYRAVALLWIPLLFLNQTLTYSQENLTLQEAWSIALKNNYTIQQQEKLIEKANEEISIQKTDYYPSLSTSAIFARANFDKLPFNIPNASGKVGIDLFSLSLTQPIFSGFRTKNLVESAHEGLVVQKIQKNIVQNTVLLQVGILFYDIQSNLLQQSALQASINRINNQLERIKNLYLSDQATPFDTLEIANRKLKVENQLAIFEDTEKILQSNMRYLLNEEQLGKIQPLAVTHEDFLIDGQDINLQYALQSRPELARISTRKRAQYSYSEVLKARYYPQLSASLAYNYMKPTGDILKNEWTNFYSIFVNLQWELWNWKRDAKKVQQARLDLENLDLEELQLTQDIRHQVKIAYQHLLSSKKNIKLQERLVDQEKQRYNITENRYNQGLATFLDLNSAELALTEAETQLHKNFITWYKNKLQLDFATGNISQNNMEASDE